MFVWSSRMYAYVGLLFALVERAILCIACWSAACALHCPAPFWSFRQSARGLRALHADTARWFSVLQRADIALLLEMLSGSISLSPCTWHEEFSSGKSASSSVDWTEDFGLWSSGSPKLFAQDNEWTFGSSPRRDSFRLNPCGGQLVRTVHVPIYGEGDQYRYAQALHEFGSILWTVVWCHRVQGTVINSIIKSPILDLYL
jgi:hypothetical protein